MIKITKSKTKMESKTIFSILILLAIFLSACNQSIQQKIPDTKTVNSFEECARAGYQVGESYPRQCWTPDGKHFVEEIKQGQPLTPGPITISGEVTCLPSKMGTEEINPACIYGLKGSDGKYYGLLKINPDFIYNIGQRITISGLLKPASHDFLSSYDAVGQIEVETITGVEIESSNVELIGTFHTIFGDPQNMSGPGSIDYFLIDEQGKWTKLIITSNTKFIGGKSTRDFNRHKVKVTEKQDSKTKFVEAFSIEIID